MSEKPRVLLKISGETLSGKARYGHSREAMDFMAEEIVSVENRYELAIVVGGGNIIRGSRLIKDLNIDATAAHNAGMHATVINGAIFKCILREHYGLPVRHLITPNFHVGALGERYTVEEARAHLDKGRIIILTGGTGVPFGTTDGAMVNLALQVNASVALKGTKVDGIYEQNPDEVPEAKKIPRMTYDEYIQRNLKILDVDAVALARNSELTIKVFKIFEEKGNLKRILAGEDIGSIISA